MGAFGDKIRSGMPSIPSGIPFRHSAEVDKGSLPHFHEWCVCVREREEHKPAGFVNPKGLQYVCVWFVCDVPVCARDKHSPHPSVLVVCECVCACVFSRARVCAFNHQGRIHRDSCDRVSRPATHICPRRSPQKRRVTTGDEEGERQNLEKKREDQDPDTNLQRRCVLRKDGRVASGTCRTFGRSA